MHALDRPEFMPPAPPGLMRAFGLALLAHVLLMVALTFAVNWKHQPDVVSVSAELWSALPQEAAPKLVETPPEPEPEPKLEPKPAPKVEAPKPDPALAEAEINLKKEKKRKEEKLRHEEEKKRELAKKEAEKLNNQNQDIQNDNTRRKVVQTPQTLQTTTKCTHAHTRRSHSKHHQTTTLFQVQL